jgi:hypothetical protein
MMLSDGVHRGSIAGSDAWPARRSRCKSNTLRPPPARIAMRHSRREAQIAEQLERGTVAGGRRFHASLRLEQKRARSSQHRFGLGHRLLDAGGMRERFSLPEGNFPPANATNSSIGRRAIPSNTARTPIARNPKTRIVIVTFSLLAERPIAKARSSGTNCVFSPGNHDGRFRAIPWNLKCREFKLLSREASGIRGRHLPQSQARHLRNSLRRRCSMRNSAGVPPPPAPIDAVAASAADGFSGRRNGHSGYPMDPIGRSRERSAAPGTLAARQSYSQSSPTIQPNLPRMRPAR